MLSGAGFLPSTVVCISMSVYMASYIIQQYSFQRQQASTSQWKKVYRTNSSYEKHPTYSSFSFLLATPWSVSPWVCQGAQSKNVHVWPRNNVVFCAPGTDSQQNVIKMPQRSVARLRMNLYSQMTDAPPNHPELPNSNKKRTLKRIISYNWVGLTILSTGM